MNKQLTILIPTSPIPSHPSCAILDETVSNVRKYTDAKIIIMIDGCHESLQHRMEDYRKYIDEVGRNIESKKYGDCKAIVFNEHTHQVKMTKTVLRDEVTTPLIFFVEHDTHIAGDIPFQQICDLVESDKDINYIRFSIFDQMPYEHWYLMISKQPALHKGIPLIHTIQFSARPHIAKSNWYRNLLIDYFNENDICMIEDKIHGVVQDKYKHLKGDIFGLYIYAPEGNMLRSFHSDGRGTDEKIIEA